MRIDYRVSLPLWAVLLSPILNTATKAEVRLPSLISDNMAIQQEVPTNLWGWAHPGEKVAVSFGATTLPSATADADGRWTLSLPPQKAGRVADLVIAGSKNSITVHNIIAGEVWLCSGQSNMEFSLKGLANSKEEIEAADHPDIRIFNVHRITKEDPADDVSGTWSVCKPDTVKPFTAVGYFFGREIHDKRHVPVGLIESAWGGTVCEAWTSREAIARKPELSALLDKKNQYSKEYPQLVKKYEEDNTKWIATTQAAATAQTSKLRAPKKPPAPDENPNLATVLYNGMIAPITPYKIRGAIWYQGESNASRAYQYRTLLPTMITDWRNRFGVGNFPFGIVQLANFTVDGTWAELREAQSMTVEELPNCGLAVAIDVGNPKDIHPKNKQAVGHRLALWALASVYGEQIEYSGPVYQSMKSDGNTIRIAFNHVSGGLKTQDGGPVKGFIIAADDQKFVPAEAEIQGDAVLVRSLGVINPRSVRYGWADSPECNLVNQAGLPAVPFRTDNWKELTRDNR